MLIVEFEENHVAKSFIGLNELRNEDKQFGLMTDFQSNRIKLVECIA